LQQESTDPEHKRAIVKGLLIADRIRPGDEAHGIAHQNAGTFDIRKWSNLLTSTETMHEDFLKVVKSRVPADDPRMENLPADDTKVVRKTVRHLIKAKNGNHSQGGRKGAQK
jgi:hypothetical protein